MSIVQDIAIAQQYITTLKANLGSIEICGIPCMTFHPKLEQVMRAFVYYAAKVHVQTIKQLAESSSVEFIKSSERMTFEIKGLNSPMPLQEKLISNASDTFQTLPFTRMVKACVAFNLPYMLYGHGDAKRCELSVSQIASLTPTGATFISHKLANKDQAAAFPKLTQHLKKVLVPLALSNHALWPVREETTEQQPQLEAITTTL